MLDYATFGANDIEQSKAFFDATLAPLGYAQFYNDGWVGYAPDGNPEKGHVVWVGSPYDGQAAQKANGFMIGFTAPTREAVRAFHAAALANGGTCEGEPGLREAYGPNIYMAYVRDPVGNKMSAICRSET